VLPEEDEANAIVFLPLLGLSRDARCDVSGEAGGVGSKETWDEYDGDAEVVDEAHFPESGIPIMHFFRCSKSIRDSWRER